MASRVRPPLTKRELEDMFMGTLTGPFYSYLLGSASSSFTKLILTGERVENGLKSRKIQDATFSSKKSYGGKNEATVVSGQKGRSSRNSQD